MLGPEARGRVTRAGAKHGIRPGTYLPGWRTRVKVSSELLYWWSLSPGTSELQGNQKNLQIFWELFPRSFTLNWSCLLRQWQWSFSIRKGLMSSRVLSASSGPAHRCNPCSTAVRTDPLWCVHLFQQPLGTSGQPGLCPQGESKSDTESVGIDFPSCSRTSLCFPYDIAAEAGSAGPVRDGEVSGRQWFLWDCTV